jgi:phage shock protein PspC (stress-responsive transcriptional regulator)
VRTANEQAFNRGTDRVIGGVCSGLAARFHVDPLWARVAFVLLAFLQGIGLFIYVVLWLVMPERTESGVRSGFDPMADDLRRLGLETRKQIAGMFGGRGSAARDASAGATDSSAMLPGFVLVVVGLFLLSANIGLINWGVVWPAALIVLGIVLWVRTLGKSA